MEVIECPNCTNIDLLENFFHWMPDEHGHPTHEGMICEVCLCCNYEIEFEEDGEEKTNEVFDLEDFKLIEFDSLPIKKQIEIKKRQEERNAIERSNKSTDDLPF